jgi:hypothetical protein
MLLNPARAQASMRATNCMPLGCPYSNRFVTMHHVATLKAKAVGVVARPVMARPTRADAGASVGADAGGSVGDSAGGSGVVSGSSGGGEAAVTSKSSSDVSDVAGGSSSESGEATPSGSLNTSIPTTTARDGGGDAPAD